MKDLNEKELKEIEGGMNDRPFGTSYEGYGNDSIAADDSSSWTSFLITCLSAEMFLN